VVGHAIGYCNVEFRKGRIQDLALDLEELDAELKANPVRDVISFLAAEARAEELRSTSPLVASGSIDVVVSNCVLNLVEPRAKHRLFPEIFRVLKMGGRAVISDIVSDQWVPQEMQNDPELWSGCISGALTQDAFIAAFADAGFSSVRVLKRDQQPWRTVNGIDFRSMTIEASKGERGIRAETTTAAGPCCESGRCC
jgi:SAM-dependent methyltransferase